MTVGDRINGLVSVASGSYMDIQPGTGVEWVVHNVYHTSNVELYISDGTNEIMFDSRVGQGAWLKYAFQLTNGHYLRIKNTHASAQLISFDGVQTK